MCAYRIVSIEGTGDWKAKTKLADDLVRKSRIFWHLCKKIQKAKIATGTQRYHRLKTLDKLKTAESELRVIGREYEKHIRDIERKAKLTEERLQKRIEAFEGMKAQYEAKIKAQEKRRALDKFSYTGDLIRKTRINNKLRFAADRYNQYKLFLTKPIPRGRKWYNTNEVWLRYLVTFEELKIEKDLSNIDYYVLLSSMYFSQITAQLIMNRTGWANGTVTRAINRLVEKELLYKDGRYRYIPTHEAVAIAKNLTQAACNRSARTYFTEEVKPRKVIG